MNMYDDQYKMLAYTILARMSKSEIRRVLIDDEYVFKLILKETRSQDFMGPFLDTIIQTILDNKKRMEFNHKLDELSLYLYEQLDIDRLRGDLIDILRAYDIEVL